MEVRQLARERIAIGHLRRQFLIVDAVPIYCQIDECTECEKLTQGLLGRLLINGLAYNHNPRFIEFLATDELHEFKEGWWAYGTPDMHDYLG